MSDPKADEKLSGQPKLHPITDSARPSLVFSITSESIADGQCYQDEDCDINFEDANDWIEENCCDLSEELQSEEPPRQSPQHAAATTSTPKSKPKFSFWRKRIAELFLIQATLFAAITMHFHSSNRLSLMNAIIVKGSETIPLSPRRNIEALTKNETMIGGVESDAEDCIYVPGGGFSGFWFSLGRLQSIRHPHNETFLCYSAGCLGVVATLLHHGEILQNGKVDSTTNNDHYHDLYEMARSLQIEWQTGKRHRYRVVEAFIDGLMKKIDDLNDESRALFFDTIISNMNVITTAFDDDTVNDNEDMQLPLPRSILPRAFVRRPSDISSLKRLLLQSSWIPLATGSSWTHKGHMDGGFSMAQHPKCSRSVGLTAEVSGTNKNGTEESSSSLQNQALLLGNTLNMELSREDVGKLWKIGMEHGV